MASNIKFLTRFSNTITTTMNQQSTSITGSYINVVANTGSLIGVTSSNFNSSMIYAPYVPLQMQNINTSTEYVNKYIIPIGAAVYIDSDIHTIEYVREALKLKSIEHLYNKNTNELLMFIDNECTFDDVDIISKFYNKTGMSPTITSSLNDPIQNSIINFKLPRPYLGITSIATFEYKHIKEKVVKK